MNPISGRLREQALLTSVLSSKAASFLAVYGRRRVGKTYLIREFFKKRGVFFEVTGLKDGPLSSQLENFRDAFQQKFYPDLPIAVPRSWKEAFALLSREMEKHPDQKMIVFLDELPWLASPRSGLIQQLDYFWNSRWSQQKNLILIVCGSAASWMLEHLIHAKGGLHNRLTHTLRLLPFTLGEAADYLKHRGIHLSLFQILELYMAMGGVPYYLDRVKKGQSAAQAINDICLKREGLLFSEFDKLFTSLFGERDPYLKLILEIARHRYGINREILLEKSDLSTGGRAYQRLQELEEAGFISAFVPYGKKTDVSYRIIDEYTWFYLKWISPRQRGILAAASGNVWLKQVRTPLWNTWSGYAFEMVCMKHAAQIAQALGIADMPFETGTWWYRPKATEKKYEIAGAQIDLLFDRDDGAISVCEIKYSNQAFVIDKPLALALDRKKEIFQEQTKTRKQLFMTLISPFGVKPSAWASEVIASSVPLTALFAKAMYGCEFDSE